MRKLVFALMAMAATAMTSCAQQKQKMEEKQTAKKVLVAYFSATGNTARAARTLADATGGTIYEITPEKKYTSADLDWNDKMSRSSVEMHDKASRPTIKKGNVDVKSYDIVFLGFPIWWDEAPRVINTFIESHDLKGKVVVPFATSGGSSIDNSAACLKRSYPDIKWKEGKLLNGVEQSEMKEWADNVME